MARWEVRVEEWRERLVTVDAVSDQDARRAALHPVQWLASDPGPVVHIEPLDAYEVFSHEESDAMPDDPDPMQLWKEVKEQLIGDE